MKYQKKYKPALWKSIKDASAAATASSNGDDGSNGSGEHSPRTNGNGSYRKFIKRSSFQSGARKKRLVAVSKRSLPRRRQYSAAAKQWKLQNPLCQCCRLIWNRKPEPTTEVHHSRGRVSTLLLDQRFWKAACSECHDWIHQNPSLAQGLGLFCRMGKWNTPPKHGRCDGCGCRVAGGVLECGACLMERK